MHPYRTPQPPPPTPRWRLHPSGVAAVAKLLALYVAVQLVAWCGYWTDTTDAASAAIFGLGCGVGYNLAKTRITFLTKGHP